MIPNHVHTHGQASLNPRTMHTYLQHKRQHEEEARLHTHTLNDHIHYDSEGNPAAQEKEDTLPDQKTDWTFYERRAKQSTYIRPEPIRHTLMYSFLYHPFQSRPPVPPPQYTA